MMHTQKSRWGGFGVVVGILVGALVYTQVTFHTYRQHVTELHIHSIENALASAYSDLHMVEHSLEQDGRVDPFWVGQAKASLRHVNEASALYAESTGHNLFPFTMTAYMSNILGFMQQPEWTPEDEALFRNVVADWRMIRWEIYPEALIRRADISELAAAYDQLVQSLRTPIGPQRPTASEGR